MKKEALFIIAAARGTGFQWNTHLRVDCKLSWDLRVEELSLHFPSATHQWQDLLEGSSYTYLEPQILWVVCVFCSCFPGNTSWLPGSSGQGSLWSWVPQHYNNWRDSSWLAATPGDCTDSSLKHTPSLSVKEDYLLLLEFRPERQASGLTHI